MIKAKQTHNPFADFFGAPENRAARELKLHHRRVERLKAAQPTGRLARKFAERKASGHAHGQAIVSRLFG